MSDPISRNAVIQMFNTADRYVADSLRLCDTDKQFPQNEVFIVDDMYEGLEQLPSAEPETHEKRTETHECDLISRQAAIDALVNHSYPVRYDFGFTSIENGMTVTGIRQALSELPSAQPKHDISKANFLCPICGAEMEVLVGEWEGK